MNNCVNGKMPASRGGMVHGVMPPHYLHELPAQDEERLEKIFQKLDLDGNGRIDVHDLSKALHEVGVHKQYAEVIVFLFFIFILFFPSFQCSKNDPIYFPRVHKRSFHESSSYILFDSIYLILFSLQFP